jgi:formylglycine-generating enzyme required for sulfatase activity
MNAIRFVVFFAVAFFLGASVQSAMIETVPVGNPGNAADSTGFGAVAYEYYIGKYEVTNAQYVEFLNGVDPTGANTRGLYSSFMSSSPLGGINFNSGAANGSKFSIKTGYSNMPVVFVSFFDAVRFTNWLHNGQGSGSTETGAYTLLGGTPTPSNGNTLTRDPAAKFWVPSENEWYKAAYHQPAAEGGDSDDYWLYPMQTNSVPFSDQPPGATPDNTRVGNFFKNDGIANGYDDGYAVTGSTSFPSGNALTNVGAYSQSNTFYGTFDQGGNVQEWNDTMVTSLARGVRGGMWTFDEVELRSSRRSFLGPTFELSDVGFRVATIPEPGSVTLSMVALFVLALLRRRK